MAEIITQNVLSLDEANTLIGQNTQALIMYDTSTGEAKGLDANVLINMNSSIQDTGNKFISVIQSPSQAIGSSSNRLSKLWAIDTEFTNIPTINGNLLLSNVIGYNPSIGMSQNAIYNNISQVGYLSNGSLAFTSETSFYVNSSGIKTSYGLTTLRVDTIPIPTDAIEVNFVSFLDSTAGNYAFLDSSSNVISVYKSTISGATKSLVPLGSATLIVTRWYTYTQSVSYKNLLSTQFSNLRSSGMNSFYMKSYIPTYSNEIANNGAIKTGSLSTTRIAIFIINNTDTISISTHIGGSGSNLRKTYAFYSSLFTGTTTVPVNYISGSESSAADRTLSNLNVTVPSGAKVLFVSYESTNSSLPTVNYLTPTTNYDLGAKINNDSYPTNILLVGDSLTALGSGYANYINVGGSYATIYNTIYSYGVGGETTKGILGRLGAIPFQLSTDVSIPADSSIISIPIVSSWDSGSVGTLGSTLYGLNPCTIRGVTGNISVSSGSINFSRITSGTSIIAKSGEIIIPTSPILNDCILILWMGQNGGFSDFDDLLHQYKIVAEKCKTKKYIFISSHLNTNDAYELSMRKEFGSKYINMRNWCVKYGLEECGLTATSDDLSAISLGNCPPQLLRDGIHFIDLARSAQASFIIRRARELNYII